MTVEIKSLFNQWNQAIQTGDPDTVVALYHPEAVLLPTMSNTVCNTHADIKNYFISFLIKHPVGELNESHTRLLAEGTIAFNSGIYTFSFNDNTSVKARYSYVYRYDNDKWLIIEHHSSQMPEKI